MHTAYTYTHQSFRSLLTDHKYVPPHVYVWTVTCCYSKLPAEKESAHRLCNESARGKALEELAACHSTAEHTNEPSAHHSKLGRIQLLAAETLPTACSSITQTVVGYCQNLATAVPENMLCVSATSTVWIRDLPSQGAMPLSRISYATRQPRVRFLTLDLQAWPSSEPLLSPRRRAHWISRSTNTEEHEICSSQKRYWLLKKEARTTFLSSPVQARWQVFQPLPPPLAMFLPSNREIMEQLLLLPALWEAKSSSQKEQRGDKTVIYSVSHLLGVGNRRQRARREIVTPM